MRESNKTIGYFEESLREFETRLHGNNGGVRLDVNNSRMRSLPVPPGSADPSIDNYTKAQQLQPFPQYQRAQVQDERSNNVRGSSISQDRSPSRGKRNYTNLGIVLRFSHLSRTNSNAWDQYNSQILSKLIRRSLLPKSLECYINLNSSYMSSVNIKKESTRWPNFIKWMVIRKRGWLFHSHCVVSSADPALR
jgi:hypothetical protein